MVTFRSGDTLPACLAALQAAAPMGTELLVVDNAADATVVELVERTWAGACVQVNSVNRGFAAAVNQALRRARGDAILLLNPDAVIEPATIGTLRAALAALPMAGIVAPRLLSPAGEPLVSGYPFLTLGTVIWRHFQLVRVFPNAQLGRYRQRTLAGGAPFRVDWAQGACLLVRRAVFEQLGQFDADFFFYAEEVDFMRRAARAGWSTYIVPAAVAHHAEGGSSSQVVPLKLASHYLSKVVYFEKHHAPPRRHMLRALLVGDLGLRILYRAYGILSGRPRDARLRLVTYARTARMLLASPTRTIVREWRSMGEGAATEQATSGGTQRREPARAAS